MCMHGVTATDYYMNFYIIVVFPLTAILLFSFYSFIIFSLLINAVILLLNCLILKLYLYMHFLFLKCYFLYLNIIWTFISRSLYCFSTSISHGVENYFPRLWGMGILVL